LGFSTLRAAEAEPRTTNSPGSAYRIVPVSGNDNRGMNQRRTMIIAGRLVNSDGVTPGQIRIEGERIVEVGPRLETRLGPADVEFGDDCLIFAGMGDIHIHARDDVSQKEVYKEDFGTAAAAAIHGGVVHVADMPNNPAAPIDDVSYAAKRRHLDRRQVPITITLYAGIGPGTRPLSSDVPYKVYMGPSVGTSSLQRSKNSMRPSRGIGAPMSAFTAKIRSCLTRTAASRRTNAAGRQPARSPPRGSRCR